jgi:hypothetical protein
MSEAVPAATDGVYAYSRHKSARLYHLNSGKNWPAPVKRRRWWRMACGLVLSPVFANEQAAIPAMYTPCPGCFKAAK